MFLPAVNDWAKQNRIAVSKLMIPLSYAAVLSGTVTMISTATNLLVNGMLLNAKGHSMHMFELTWVGLPITIVGVLFVVAFNKWLLPDRRPAIEQFGDTRQYSVEMMVDPAGPLVGKTIEQAGLRQLPNAFLAEIEREGEILPVVGPEVRLHANDRLVFVGVVGAVVDLQKIRGLQPATDQIFKLDSPRERRCLIEAVVSPRCPIIGMTIREGGFRSLYNAVVIAVARSGERINKKIGDIVVQSGDTLLLEAHPSFADHSAEFAPLLSRQPHRGFVAGQVRASLRGARHSAGDDSGRQLHEPRHAQVGHAGGRRHAAHALLHQHPGPPQRRMESDSDGRGGVRAGHGRGEIGAGGGDLANRDRRCQAETP